MNASVIAIIELILKGTALLLAGCAGAAFLARSSAAHRSLWWLGVFATLLLLPLTMLVRPVWTLPVPNPWQASVAPATLPAAALPPEYQTLRATPPTHVSKSPQMSFQQWLFAAYGCGVIVVLTFRILGTAQLRSLRRAAAADAEMQYIIDGWRKMAGMRRHIRVFTNSQVTVPMTWGTWRPVIVLPKDCREWPSAEFHAALQHEFAHVRHFDALRRWLGTMVSALWWPHPLAWFAVRAWKLEQERACDDAVLNQGGDAATYAQQLLTAASGLRLSRFQAAAALIMAMPAGLDARLRSVMSQRMDRSPVRMRTLLGCGAMTLLALAAGVAIQTQLIGAAPAAPAAAQTLEQQAAKTIIPKLEFREATPVEVLTFIAEKAGFQIQYSAGSGNKTRLTLSQKNISAADALQQVAKLMPLKITYEEHNIWADGRAADGTGEPNSNTITYALGTDNTVHEPLTGAMKKADRIVIPKIDFHDTPLLDALDFLRKKAVALDPAKEGVPIILKPGSDSSAKLTMDMTDMPLIEALRYVAELSSLKLRLAPDALVLEPEGAAPSQPAPRPAGK